MSHHCIACASLGQRKPAKRHRTKRNGRIISHRHHGPRSARRSPGNKVQVRKWRSQHLGQGQSFEGLAMWELMTKATSPLLPVLFRSRLPDEIAIYWKEASNGDLTLVARHGEQPTGTALGYHHPHQLGGEFRMLTGRRKHHRNLRCC